MGTSSDEFSDPDGDSVTVTVGPGTVFVGPGAVIVGPGAVTVWVGLPGSKSAAFPLLPTSRPTTAPAITAMSAARMAPPDPCQIGCSVERSPRQFVATVNSMGHETCLDGVTPG